MAHLQAAAPGAPLLFAAANDDSDNSAAAAKQQALMADCSFAFTHACAMISKVLPSSSAVPLTTALFISQQPHASRENLRRFLAEVAELQHALEHSEELRARVASGALSVEELLRRRAAGLDALGAEERPKKEEFSRWAPLTGAVEGVPQHDATTARLKHEAVPAPPTMEQHRARGGGGDHRPGAEAERRGRSGPHLTRHDSPRGRGGGEARSPPRSRSRPRHDEAEERARTVYVKYIPAWAERSRVREAVEDALRVAAGQGPLDFGSTRHSRPEYVASVSLLPRLAAHHTWVCARVVLVHARDVRDALRAHVRIGDVRLQLSQYRKREELQQHERRAPQQRAEHPAEQLQQAAAVPAPVQEQEPQLRVQAPVVLASVGGWEIIPGAWLPPAAPLQPALVAAAAVPALPAATVPAARDASPTALSACVWAGALAHSGAHRCNAHAVTLSAGAVDTYVGTSTPALPPTLNCAGTCGEDAAAQYLKDISKRGRVAAVYELRPASADADALPLAALAANLRTSALVGVVPSGIQGAKLYLLPTATECLIRALRVKPPAGSALLAALILRS
jgi:hypothetical protein